MENKTNGLEFRTLRADEIECRIGTVVDGKGLSLLLYKDARVDMTLLDETVGPMNWQREHYNSNANCVLSIWDEKKASWVKKDDVGTPSNTEAEKGLASDSFKRAATNWGIGRELYTAPFIWIPASMVTIQDKKARDFYPKVVEVTYDDARNITGISIINEKTGEVIFNTIGRTAASSKPAATQKAEKPKADKKPAPAENNKAENKPATTTKTAQPKPEAKPEEKPAEADPNRPLNEAEINVILKKAAEKHLNIEVICKVYGITTLKQMSAAQFPGCIKKLDATKDQKKEASA